MSNEIADQSDPTSISPFATAEHFAFVAARSPKAQEALKTLEGLYPSKSPADADVIVALGGDGFMLQTIHKFMAGGKPIYGMNRGSVGFMMNPFSAEFAAQSPHDCIRFAWRRISKVARGSSCKR